MMSNLCIALLVVVVAVTGAEPTESVCETQSLCVCQTAQGTIDLTGLSTFNITSKDGKNYYQFNPCETFTLGDGCQDVLGCQTSPLSDPKFNAIASATNYTYRHDGDDYAIDYKAGNRSMTVRLVCNHSQEGSLDFVKEDPKDTYSFKLTSKHACLVDDTTTSSSTTSSQSTNSSSSNASTSESTTTPTSSNTTTPMSSTTMTTPESTNMTTSTMTTSSTESSTTSTPSSSNSTMTSEAPSNSTTPSGNYTTMTTQTPTTQSGSVLSPLAFATLALVALISRNLN